MNIVPLEYLAGFPKSSTNIINCRNHDTLPSNEIRELLERRTDDRQWLHSQNRSERGGNTSYQHFETIRVKYRPLHFLSWSPNYSEKDIGRDQVRGDEKATQSQRV